MNAERDPARGPARRTVVRGAAWTVPAIAVSAAAPAFAVSATCPPGCPNGGFDGGWQRNGWSAVVTGTYVAGTGGFGYQASYTPNNFTNPCTGKFPGSTTLTLTNVILVEQDPVTVASTLAYRKDFCLMAGITYTFTFDWTYYGANPQAAYLDAALRDPNGAPVASATRVSAPGSGTNQKGTRTFSFTPTVDTWYAFQYSWTFAGPGSTQCSTRANDIAVTAPVVTCSSTPPGG